MTAWLDQLHRKLPAARNKIEEGHQSYWKYHDQATNERGFQDYADILRRRKWTVLLSLFTTLSVVIVGLLLTQPAYESQALILIEEHDSTALPIQQGLTPNYSWQTEVELIQDRVTIEKVVDLLDLANPCSKARSRTERDDPSAVTSVAASVTQLLTTTIAPVLSQLISPIRRLQEGEATPGSRDMYRQEIIEEFQAALKVVPREGTNLAEIRLQGDDSRRVAEQLDALLDIYIQDHQASKLRETQRALAWLEDEANRVKLNMQKSSSNLHEFRANHEVLNHDNRKRQDVNTSGLIDLNSAYLSLKRERLMLETHIGKLTESPQKSGNLAAASRDPQDKALDLDSTVLKNQVVKALYHKYVGLQADLVRFSQIYKEKHPRIMGLHKELEETKSSIIKALQHEYESLAAKEKKLRRELYAQRQRAIRQEHGKEQYTDLKDDFEIHKSLYLDILKKQRELSLLNRSRPGHVKIVRGASVPLSPLPSGALYKLLAGLVIGLGIGTAFACVAEYGDKRFKQAGETERYLQLPLLSIIPKHKIKPRQACQSILLQTPHSTASEAYRILRTRLQLLSSKPGCALLVTSALPREGKSTTAANLGIAFAQFNQKVLLVDADLRHPSLHEHFHLTLDGGLADILTHGMDWREVVHDTSIDNLKVLSAGTVATNPSELLHTEQMRQLIESLKASFDTIVFDAPIVLSIPDVEILALHMDGVLLVHNPEKYDKEITMEAKMILERANASILGVILNELRMKKQRYAQYYKRHASYYKPSYPASNGSLPDAGDGQRLLDIIDMERVDKSLRRFFQR